MQYEELLGLVESVRGAVGAAADGVEIGIVCGSGLGGLATLVENPTAVAYDEIPNFPRSTVPGHTGRLVFGDLCGHRVVVMQGRIHGYEGVSAARSTAPVRVMALLGVKILVLTNAAGGLLKPAAAGHAMVIRDHISFPAMSGAFNPLVGTGSDERWGERFVPMSDAWDSELSDMFLAVAAERGHKDRVCSGVYGQVFGPQFETASEIKLLRLVGCNAVGMSTVPEAIVARQCRLRLLGVSLITNEAVQSSEDEPASHQEVLEAGRAGASMMESLMTGFLARLKESQQEKQAK